MISFNGHVLMWLYKPYGVTYDDTYITIVYLDTLNKNSVEDILQTNNIIIILIVSLYIGNE